MISTRTTYRFSRPIVTAERIVAIAAVALTAFGFAQPQVLALAGFDFDKPHVASAATDPAPTGSIASSARPMIHGLAGVLKPLRERD